MKLSTTAWFVCAGGFALPILANAVLPINSGDQQEPWVLVETHISDERNGGSLGSSFQEFSSKARCEAAIKLLMELSKRHRGELGGGYKAPIAQCILK
ncbi:MAG: hypothetical protein EOO81_02215 [Oxalobacteraceae bacterium]|nr:MAG: hypothetical protein EOO81_02215 [Oxalobacteraceae bacterium]